MNLLTKNDLDKPETKVKIMVRYMDTVNVSCLVFTLLTTFDQLSPSRVGLLNGEYAHFSNN